LDVLADWAVKTQAITETQPAEYLKFVQSMPNDWLEFYTQALARAQELERPTPQLFALRNRLSVLANVMGAPSALVHPHLHALIELLRRSSGYSDFEQLASEPDNAVRRQRALQLVKLRYEADPERALEPTFALRQLVRMPVVASGRAAIALDYELGQAVPVLAPFLQPSAAVEVIDLLSSGIRARLAGRYDEACLAYREIIERLSRPDRGGLDQANHSFVYCGVNGALGVMEAGMGLASCLSRADAVQSEPLYHVSALQIRMLYELWRGRGREADQIKERIELLRIETSPRQLGDGTHFIGQVTAHANSDDLTRMKHSLDEIRVFARRHPSWTHVLQYAQGEYQRIRGDYALAATQLQPLLAAISAGKHQIWPHAVAAYTRVLSSLGRADQAIEFATRQLTAAEAARIGYLTHYIRMPLALALAEAGQSAAAAQLADAVLQDFEALHSEGLNLVLAYETRARVAVSAQDTAGYEQFAKRCAQHCRSSGSRALSAKYERLVRSATAAAVHVPGAVPDHVLATLTGTQLTSVLVGCHKPSERAERTLQLLLRRSGARAGYLYLIGDHGPELAAQVGDREASGGLTAAVSEFVNSQLEDMALKTQSADAEGPATCADAPDWSDERGERHHLVLLSHQTTEGFAVTGAAALITQPGTPIVHPGSLAAHLSRLTFDAGDVTPILGE
jgi:tetratricopeptide (TPR) repeat protein